MIENLPIHSPIKPLPESTSAPFTESEIILPPNVSHKFVFRRHLALTHEDYWTVKDELYEGMKGIFQPKQRNILLLESPEGPNEVIVAEYARRRSLREALLVASVLRSQGVLPKSNDIKRTMEAYKERIKLITDPTTLYTYATAHAIDALNSQGYRIELQHEEHTPEARHFYYKKNAHSVEEYREMMQELQEGTNMRDRVVARQVQELTCEAAGEARQVNIMTLMGTSHAGMIRSLPRSFQAETKTVVDTTTLGTGFIDKVSDLLVEGADIPDQLWQAAYQEYSQYSRS